MQPKTDSITNTTEAPANENPGFKRKLSKREKKDQKKRDKEAKMKDKENTSPSGDGVAVKLYNELPDTSFTRSISNPEAVMRKRRQIKLEKKLQQIRSKDGGPDQGGLNTVTLVKRWQSAKTYHVSDNIYCSDMGCISLHCIFIIILYNIGNVYNIYQRKPA